MQYPLSPFNSDFDTNLLLTKNDCVSEQQITSKDKIYLKRLLKWLCTTPKYSTVRINTIRSNAKEVQSLIQMKITEKGLVNTKTKLHAILPDVLVIYNTSENSTDLIRHNKEVIVDVTCAAAILRGAHIFAPGVLGMLTGTKTGDLVSVYADLLGKCKKGLSKVYNCSYKHFIGNGLVKMCRYELFGENLQPVGVAVEMLETISNCPTIGDDFLKGFGLLQNLPSILCVNVLNPKSNDCILDMCASPGNKATHIAALMNNKGVLIAIDKTSNKVKRLQETCNQFRADIKVFKADSTQIVDNSKSSVLDGPPFPAESFDKILLDAPCSALGKRPQLSNKITEKVIRSFVPIQKKLFQNAVELLKVNGTLLYSTCTITLAENEGIITWALRKFPCLELAETKPHLGGPALMCDALNDIQRNYIQRFGPDEEIDSVGFFLALFIKKV